LPQKHAAPCNGCGSDPEESKPQSLWPNAYKLLQYILKHREESLQLAYCLPGV